MIWNFWSGFRGDTESAFPGNYGKKPSEEMEGLFSLFLSIVRRRAPRTLFFVLHFAGDGNGGRDGLTYGVRLIFPFNVNFKKRPGFFLTTCFAMFGSYCVSRLLCNNCWTRNCKESILLCIIQHSTSSPLAYTYYHKNNHGTNINTRKPAADRVATS